MDGKFMYPLANEGGPPQGRAIAANSEIWYKDLKAFLDTRYLLDFWPSSLMTIEERINAATRFIVYASLILTLTVRRSKYIVFGLFLIGLLSFVYHRATNTHQQSQ